MDRGKLSPARFSAAWPSDPAYCIAASRLLRGIATGVAADVCTDRPDGQKAQNRDSGSRDLRRHVLSVCQRQLSRSRELARADRPQNRHKLFTTTNSCISGVISSALIEFQISPRHARASSRLRGRSGVTLSATAPSATTRKCGTDAIAGHTHAPHRSHPAAFSAFLS